MARNGYIACNQLCGAQNVKDIWSAKEWVLALAVLPDIMEEQMMLMTKMIAELLVRLTIRGRQLEQWLLTTTRYGCKGRRVSAESLALITDIQIILVGEWYECTASIL